MTSGQPRVAILFPADASKGPATTLADSRLAYIGDALRAEGIDAIAAPYADAYVEAARKALRGIDGVLVWYNPIEAGRDRTILNALLRDVAATGAFVSAHPDVIDRMGTKEVLYRTRAMSWGCDTHLYQSADAMRSQLPGQLAASGARVLKQIRGQSGDGVWKVELAESAGDRATASVDAQVRVRHARRGSIEQRMTLGAFVAQCQPYFAAGGGMINQPYQPRLAEGMVRCYVVGDRVGGFGEQLVNALYPAPPGASASAAPQPGPRHYFPPTRPDFQRLKAKLEGEWIGELCRIVGIGRQQLPVLWDADFLYGPKDAAGDDTYVLCEINISSVYPFPQDALAPLVAATLARVKGKP